MRRNNPQGQAICSMHFKSLINVGEKSISQFISKWYHSSEFYRSASLIPVPCAIYNMIDMIRHDSTELHRIVFDTRTGHLILMNQNKP
jgi:hypothetical protein